MKHPLRYLLLFCCFTCCLGCMKPTVSQENKKISYPENLRILHENTVNYFLNAPSNESEVNELVDDLQTDGSWTIIDYANNVRGGWPVKTHLDQVQTLAVAYNKKGNKYYQNPDLSEKIHRSLNYWLKNDFLSPNWHDQHIGVPERLLPTLFLMESELSKKQLDQSMELLHRAKIKMTGQNKVWLATNVMLRSLLLRKADSVAIASKAIQGELQIANGVGIKKDWSYHEHGAQLQFGNYGLSFLEDMIKCNTLLANTPYKFTDDKLAILRNYILEGQQWVIWNKKYDISASGRQLFPDEQNAKYRRLSACIDLLKALDKDNADVYDNAINSKVLSGDKHFWESDFYVHRRKEFYFSLKMSSNRVIGTESVNEENTKGYYMGDGVTSLYTGGEENNEIIPFWDWKKLPGVTNIQTKEDLPVIKAWDFKTEGTFVGGVTNGQNGVAVMDYNRDGVTAHKSWFMFDDKILCLGSQITAETPLDVTTGVNQVFLKGAVDIKENGVLKRESERTQGLRPDWILHNNVGYLFPEKQDVKMESRFLEGSWHTLVSRLRPIILTEHILRIWMDHGKNPKNAGYAYILVPNADQQQMDGLLTTPPFDYKNSGDVQYCTNNEGNLAGIVFYKAGTVPVFGGISVNKPCVLLIEKREGGLYLHVSEPTQKLAELQISIQGNFKGDNVVSSENRTKITLILPTGGDAGKTLSIQLNR